MPENETPPPFSFENEILGLGELIRKQANSLEGETIAWSHDGQKDKTFCSELLGIVQKLKALVSAFDNEPLRTSFLKEPEDPMDDDLPF